MNRPPRRPSAPFRVGRTAEEYRLHQLSCAYWRNPETRRRLGLPDDETIRRATVSVDRRPALGLMLSQRVAACRPPLKKSVRPKVGRASARAIRPGPLLPPEVFELIRAVAAEWNHTVDQMLSRERWAGLALARHVAMIAALLGFGATQKQVARWFNRKDHSTIAHAAQHVRDLMDTDAAFRNRVTALTARLGITLQNQTEVKEELKNSGTQIPSPHPAPLCLGGKPLS